MAYNIEFRAWPIKNMYYFCGDQPQILGVIKINFERNSLELASPEGKGRDAEFDEISLMQYSGMNDTSGKKIYEEDIVNFKKGNGVVRMKNGEWVIEYFDENKYKNYSLYDAVMEDKIIMVIGNTYETPHLISPEINVINKKLKSKNLSKIDQKKLIKLIDELKKRDLLDFFVKNGILDELIDDANFK